MKRTTYFVYVNHPTNFFKGIYELTVTANRDGSRYVSGNAFGCSRDYPTESDCTAIRCLLREHAACAKRIVAKTGQPAFTVRD